MKLGFSYAKKLASRLQKAKSQQNTQPNFNSQTLSKEHKKAAYPYAALNCICVYFQK